MSQLEALRAANIARQAEWCPDQIPDLSFRGNELAGEIGEACNVIKKLERERLGWRGSRDTVEHLAEELADGIICIDLVAERVGIDLWPAVMAKFNSVSEARELATRLRLPAQFTLSAIPSGTYARIQPGGTLYGTKAVKTITVDALFVTSVRWIEQNERAYDGVLRGFSAAKPSITDLVTPK